MYLGTGLTMWHWGQTLGCTTCSEIGCAPVGWVARDVATRLRGEIGIFYWDQWRQCADELGILWLYVEDTMSRPAMLLDGAILIRSDMDPVKEARWAWHEIGHHLLHDGDMEWWRALPGGQYFIAKAERQADEFAEFFPVWN